MWQGRREQERSYECAAARAEEDECRAGKKMAVPERYDRA